MQTVGGAIMVILVLLFGWFILTALVGPAPIPGGQQPIVRPVPPQPTQQAAPPQGGAAPMCSAINPSSAIGGTWMYFAGNQWRKAAGTTETVRGAQGWVVHTPNFPSGNVGLPIGSSEPTTVATAYNMNCRTQ